MAMNRTLAAVLAALVAMGAGGLLAAYRAYPAFVGYETPFASSVRSDDAPPPVARPVVVFLVDGLRLDVSRGLPFLNELRRRGADLQCRVGSPSFSLPARGVLWTGAWAEVHGQLLNFRPRPVRVEHLFESARRRGLRTALAASPDVQSLFPSHIDRRVVYAGEKTVSRSSAEAYTGDLLSLAADARVLLDGDVADLTVIEIPTTDGAGHSAGGASPVYRAVAEGADLVLRGLASGLDLERAVLVVTSDHGHTDAGGHGGDEPEVMEVPLVLAGRGIRPGTTGRAQQIDIAPTLAVILGVPIPRASRGAILEVWDEAASAGAAERARVAKAQREAADRDAAVVLGATPEERTTADMRRRTVGAFLILMAPIAVLIAVTFTPERRFLLPAIGSAAIAGLAYQALRPVLGLSTSLSALNRDEDLPRFLAINAVLALVLGAAAAAGVTRWAAPAGLVPRPGDRALLAALCAVAYLAPFAARGADVYVRAGFVMEWALVDMRARYGLYQDALAAAAVGLLSPLVAAFASVLRAPLDRLRTGDERLGDHARAVGGRE